MTNLLKGILTIGGAAAACIVAVKAYNKIKEENEKHEKELMENFEERIKDFPEEYKEVARNTLKNVRKQNKVEMVKGMILLVVTTIAPYLIGYIIRKINERKLSMKMEYILTIQQ